MAGRRENHDDGKRNAAAKIRRDRHPVGGGVHRGEQQKNPEEQTEHDRDDAHESSGTLTGGRTQDFVHTFTEVADFGGGFVAPLNGTLIFAPECAPQQLRYLRVQPGVDGLGVGNHSFQCCIHPWMRMLIKVEAEETEEEHKH